MDPKLIKRRILDERLQLPEPYRQFLYHGTFYPEHHLWVGKDGRYGLRWSLTPRVMVKGVNVGSVQLLFKEEIERILEDGSIGSD